jgi:hypothetical protein
MATRDGVIPAAWSDVLTRVLGTDEWRRDFYEPARQGALEFIGVTGPDRVVTPEAVCAFVQRRLASVFRCVSDEQLVLRNSRSSPMFSLCFASGNPTAV